MGDVYTTGWNNFGQLGQDDLKQEDENSSYGIPNWLQILNEKTQQDEKIIKIASGTSHTLALSGSISIYI